MVRICSSYSDRATLIGKYETKRSFFLEKLSNNNFNQDSFSFSTAGMRLNVLYKGQKIENVSVRSWEPVLDNDIRNNTLKDADKRISRAGKLLEQMLEIAEAAQNPELSDYERIVMQMKLGQLQHEQDHSNHIGGGSNYDLKAAGYSRNIGKSYQETDSYKMLARALDRVSKGQDWNVAEVRHTILDGMALQVPIPDKAPESYNTVRALYDTEDGWIEYLKQKRPEWNNDNVYFEKPSGDSFGMFGGMPADDENPAAIALGYVWETVDNENVPTVGEILKGTGRSVMDSKAAEVTAEELKKELEGLEKQRKQLVSLAAEYAEVQKEPNDYANKEAVQNKIMKFFTSNLPEFFNTLYRESFQFSFGKKCNVYGKTGEDVAAEMEAMQEAYRPKQLNFEEKSELNGPEIKINSGEIEIPGK